MTFILKYGAIALVAGLFWVTPAQQQACASGIAPQTCDTQVWQSMELRARMETTREVMQNQNLIFKPDSVLAYTCFDKFAAHTARHVGNLFTHTRYWGEEIVAWGSPNGMDDAMNKVVIASMKTYMDANYDHAMLGDRARHYANVDNPTLSKYITDAVPSKGGDYNCSRMSAVWRVAKCANFIHNELFQYTDGFYPFSNLQAHGEGNENVRGYEDLKDVRSFPGNMACNAAAAVFQHTWEHADVRSRILDEELYLYATPVGNTFRDVREMLEPASSGSCGNPVLTGVTIVESLASGGSTYADGICTRPGCSFVKSGSGGKCEPTSRPVINPPR